MTSKMKIKSGGAWYGPVADGIAKVKSGGVWVPPVGIKVESGGAWVDTGYSGYPNPPTNLRVNGWNYDVVHTQWTAPTSGPAVNYYVAAIRTEAGGTVAGQPDRAVSDLITYNWDVSPDTKWNFWVRAIGASDLSSAWVGPLKVGIGHATSYNYGYVNRTRGWTSAHASGARNANDPFWANCPTNVHLSGMHWRNLRTPMSSVVHPGTNRTVAVYISTGGGFHGDYGDIGPTNSGDNRDKAMNNDSDGGPWGIVPRGSGWSTTSNGTYMLWCDDFWLSGTETYANYEIISTNPAKANYYW